MASYRTCSAYRYMYSLWMFLLSIDISLIIHSNCVLAKSEVDKHLELSMTLIAQSQFQDALSHLHAAIDLDSKNYISYYRRATVFLALGRSKLGLQDLEATLELKPDFINARVQKASVLIKLGRLDEAFIELEKVTYVDDSNLDEGDFREGFRGKHRFGRPIERLLQYILHVPIRTSKLVCTIESLSEVTIKIGNLSKDANHEEAHKLMQTHERLKELVLIARDSMDNHHFDEAIQVLKDVIELSPWDSSMREMRSEALITVGDVQSAISDLRTVTKLTQDNTDAFFRLSNLYYQLGDTEFSLAEIRECLKLDPEHRQCFPLYKKVKKIVKFLTQAKNDKDNKDFQSCVSNSKRILNEEKQVPQIQFLAYDLLCVCDNGDAATNIKHCDRALEINRDARLFCNRAEAHLLNENYDEAINDFRLAMEADEHLSCGKKGMDKAQKLKKQASKKDYYKILGVKRSADTGEINKAYRKLAKKWHPDLHDGEEKEKAKKMFIDVAAAKEVLTDPEKRARFDQGEDPLDPEQQQGGGGHPFHSQFFRGGGFPGGGGGFPFGDDGPFEFKFHFN